MNYGFNEKTGKIIRVIRITVTVIITCVIIRRLVTGQPSPHFILILLLLTAPFKFYDNHVVTRKQFEDSGRGDEYNKIVKKSIVQGLIITTLAVIAMVLYAVYF